MQTAVIRSHNKSPRRSTQVLGNQMDAQQLTVREMLIEEVGIVIDYFHGASAEYLERD
jgi:hypothetical protein